mgnify:CR=1 FL=1
MIIRISDVEILDLLRRLIEEKEIALDAQCYERLISSVAEALCVELNCELLHVYTSDEPDVGSTLHISIHPESVLSEYGDVVY